MKFGFRKPSIKKSIKARTTGKIKRATKKAVNPLYGKKGMGIVNNPKKAIYNKIYSKTTIDATKPLKPKNKQHIKSSAKNTPELMYDINSNKYITQKQYNKLRNTSNTPKKKLNFLHCKKKLVQLLHILLLPLSLDLFYY